MMHAQYFFGDRVFELFGLCERAVVVVVDVGVVGQWVDVVACALGEDGDAVEFGFEHV